MLKRDRRTRKRGLTGEMIKLDTSRPVYVIAFDFSINKTACAVKDLNKDSESEIQFFYFPKHISKKDLELYRLKGVNVYPQEIYEAPELPENVEESSLEATTVEYQKAIECSYKLAGLIMHALEPYLKEPEHVYIAHEGYSFMSKGNSMLDLASYKAVLCSMLYSKGIPLDHFYTFPPSMIKKTITGLIQKGGGSAKKEQVIEAAYENSMYYTDQRKTRRHNRFLYSLRYPKLWLKAPAYKNFRDGVDDLCDSYACLRTFLFRHVDPEKFLTIPPSKDTAIKVDLKDNVEDLLPCIKE